MYQPQGTPALNTGRRLQPEQLLIETVLPSLEIDTPECGQDVRGHRSVLVAEVPELVLVLDLAEVMAFRFVLIGFRAGLGAKVPLAQRASKVGEKEKLKSL